MAMGGEGGNSALRTLLDEAEMSNTGLARAVVVAGAKEGIHLGTGTTSVRRMLNGCQPWWPVPRLVAAALSQRLRRDISITDCGFADCTPAEEDRFDGLSSAGTLDGTVRTVVELSGRDMRRRKFLLGSVFSAGAFAEPALIALTVPPAQSTAHTGSGRRIGMADVEVLTEQVTHLRQLDCRYGSGRVRAQMVQLLHHDANELLHGTYSEKTGKAMLSAVAQATRATGFMAADVGRHSLAQRYYCATRRSDVYPAQRGEIGGDISGSNGLPGSRKRKGTIACQETSGRAQAYGARRWGIRVIRPRLDCRNPNLQKVRADARRKDA